MQCRLMKRPLRMLLPLVVRMARFAGGDARVPRVLPADMSVR
jgi:hypothetical protein